MNDTINCIKSYHDEIQPWAYQLIIYYGLRFFEKISRNITGAYAMLVLAQMLLSSIIVAYVLNWLLQKGIKSQVVYGLMIYYAIMPAVGNYSIALIKDTLFSFGLLLFVILLYDLVNTGAEIIENAGYQLVLLFSLLTITMFRSNGMLIVLLTFVCVLLKKNIKNRKHLFGILLILLLINNVIDVGHKKAVSADVQFREAISIPLTQIGAVLNLEDGYISSTDKAILQQILPLDTWETGYRFSFSDPIKFNKDFDNRWINENKVLFLKTWFSVLQDNFSVCVNAYLCHTYGFWNLSPLNIFTTDFSQSYFTKINNNTEDESFWGKYLTEIGLRNSNLQSNAFFRMLVFMAKILFGLSLVLTPGIMFWLILGCLAMVLNYKTSSVGMVFLPVLLNWLTLMIAAPTSIVYRYSFYLLLTAPVLVLITFMSVGVFQSQ